MITKKTTWFLLVIILLALSINLISIDSKFIRLIYQSKIPIANRIEVKNNFAYVYNDWYVYIYSLTNQWTPLLETAFQSKYPITDIEMLDKNHIYICSHEPTNEVSEIDSLNTLGRIYFGSKLTCNKAIREGNLVYTTHRENGLEIYDISKNLYPEKLSSFSEKWGIIDFLVQYPTLHALNDFGYINIDLSDLKQPRSVGTNYEIIEGNVLSQNRNIVWIGAKNNLYAIEITYPENPVIINRYRFSSEINDLKARGNDLFVALKSTGLKILDITNPKKIAEKNSYYNRSGFLTVDVDGDYVYLGAGLKGWLILEYR